MRALIAPDKNRHMETRQFSADWAASFRASSFRLRFELGGEAFGSEAPIPRFVQAFGRARQVAHDALLGSQEVLAVVGCWQNAEHDLFAPSSDPVEALRSFGFTATSTQQWNGMHPLWGQVDDEQNHPATWQAFNVTEQLSDRDVIIWCAIAYEMAIQPKAPVIPFLLDVERGILIHIYDDRGMDVIALDRKTLMEVYRTHSSWLLDYDRQRIIEVFGILD